MAAKSLHKLVGAKQLGYYLRGGLIGVVAAALVLAFPGAVYAQYSEGAYSDSIYGDTVSPSPGSGSSPAPSASGGSATTTEPTVVTTSTGLEIAINLENGQSIPSTGYYITITPLNGQGKTFDKAEIYLDGKLIHSGAPDSDGTLRWFWDPNQYPASQIKIIVYGPGDSVITKEFTVTVTPVEATNTDQSTSPQTPEATDSQSLWLYIGAAIAALLLALGLWLFIVWRRRRRREQNQGPHYPPQ